MVKEKKFSTQLTWVTSHKSLLSFTGFSYSIFCSFTVMGWGWGGPLVGEVISINKQVNRREGCRSDRSWPASRVCPRAS